MTFRKMIAALLAICFIISLTGCAASGNNAGSSDTGSDSSSEATIAGTTQHSGADESTATTAEVDCTTAEDPAQKNDMFNLACGEIGGEFCPVFASYEGDKVVAKLIAPTMLVYDRDGSRLTTASETRTGADGKTHTYSSVVTVSEAYDAEANATTYTIKVNDGARFSDGTPITADDIIFTYYVLCDPSYDGPYKVQNQNIFGIRAYQLNNTAAPGIEITASDISDALANPAEELKSRIVSQVIRPTLEEERKWCEENWERYVDRGYGNSAAELFATLYASTIKSNYSVADKTFDQVLEETVELFGMNYKTLAKNYKNDLNYFDDTIKNITNNYLYEKACETAGGEEMPRISGISKTGEYEATVRVLGKSSSAIKSVCDIPILSLNYYGDYNSYDYTSDKFGLERGNLAPIKEKSGAPFGYGPYVFGGADQISVTLTGNKFYDGGTDSRADLKLIYVSGEDPLTTVIEGKTDLACVDLTDLEISAIKETNTDGQLSGDKLETVAYNDNTYYYFGLNCNRVNVDDGKLTEASIHLRRAIAIVISAQREEFCKKYYDNTAKLIDYPCSTSFYGMPAPGSTEQTFAALADGTAITKDNALDAAREELKLAGYEFNEEGKISHLPQGGKLEFNLLIAPYLSGDTAISSIAAEAKNILDSIGFVITIKETDDINAFIVDLDSGNADMWCAARDTQAAPLAFYSSNGNSNYYKLTDTDLDALIKSLADVTDTEERKAIYVNIFGRIMDDAIEVPIYQKQKGIVFDPEKIYIDSAAGLSEFFSLYDDISIIRPASEAPEEPETTVPETTPVETTVADTSAEDTTAEGATTVEGETSAEDTTAAESGAAESDSSAGTEGETTMAEADTAASGSEAETTGEESSSAS